MPIGPGLNQGIFQTLGYQPTNTATAGPGVNPGVMNTLSGGNPTYTAWPYQPTNSPAPVAPTTSGGGGGGGGGSSQPAAPSKYVDQSTGREFGSYDDFTREIDNVYSGSENYLNQAEQAVRADLPNALNEAQSIYNTNVSSLGNNKQTAFDTLNTQTGKATSTKENALAEARRMFQEQQMGSTQRFGGSSSAGQAASEIQNREFARNYGQTGRQYQEVVQQIETQRAGVEREYQTGILQLEQQKQGAIAQANRDFQNKLLQISQNRAQIGQAKAEARLAALQQLRSEVFAIDQQNRQFTQTLELQRQQAGQQLQAYGQSLLGATNTAGQAVSGYNPNIQMNSGVTGGMNGQTSSGGPLVGSIKKPEEQYVGIQGGFQNPRDLYNLGLG